MQWPRWSRISSACCHGAAGGGRVACCVAVVAEVVENSGRVVAVAEDVGQGEGLLIVRGGLRVVAEVAGVTEAVERVKAAARRPPGLA